MPENIDQFCVAEGAKVDLSEWRTTIDPIYKSKKDYKKLLKESTEELSAQQQMLYAADKYSLLLIFQAMDAAGKDGAIRHVMSGVNPQGCQVFSFKQPSYLELDHDFLWRTSKRMPERGRIGIFNRSYYEEVLVVRVHPQYLVGQRLPDEHLENGNIWEERYHSIVESERHLYRNGTRIIKFFLHLSKEEQRQRFLKRIDDPDKNWKFSTSDYKERQLWDKYREAYEACLSATSTDHAPWYVIPADDKKNARLIISSIINHNIAQLGLTYPNVSDKRRAELQAIRELLAAEAPKEG